MACLIAADRPASGQEVAEVTSVPATGFDSSLALGFVAAPKAPPAVPADAAAARSSPTLTALQVSFAALQLMDVVSTLRGINAGFTESNPLVRGLAAHPAAMVAVKAGETAATIFLSRRMARKNRVATIVTMAALNSVYSVVVARNLRAVSTR